MLCGAHTSSGGRYGVIVTTSPSFFLAQNHRGRHGGLDDERIHIDYEGVFALQDAVAGRLLREEQDVVLDVSTRMPLHHRVEHNHLERDIPRRVVAIEEVQMGVALLVVP